MIIDIDGIAIEVLKKPIKNMTIRIYPPDGLVKVSAPLNYSERMIRSFIQQKITWISTQQAKIQVREYPKETSWQTGSSVSYLGKNYLLVLHEHHGPEHIEINDHVIHCYSKPTPTQARIEALFDRWYRQKMEAVIPNLIEQWAPIVGVEVNEWGIKKMKTRWGSCNTRAARIWLNLNLIKKQLICLEYVLVHELVHLLEASHNKRFYAFMSKFMPQWRDYQSLLEKGKSID